MVPPVVGGAQLANMVKSRIKYNYPLQREDWCKLMIGWSSIWLRTFVANEEADDLTRILLND